MEYQLVENYYRTTLFQETVQDYFDTVLAEMARDNPILPAKGKFEIDGKIIRDYYDMPYHIHILNGLIPTLFIYEKILIDNRWIEEEITKTYLKIFILGFTFHDLNKIYKAAQENGKSELENAISLLNEKETIWKADHFFKDYELHKSTIQYLALTTENRTSVTAEDYIITVNNWEHIKSVQKELCHLADSLASIQNEQLESTEELFLTIKNSLDKLVFSKRIDISYIKIRPNPYALLSQNLLQIARKILNQNHKRVLYTNREGFVFWGENINSQEIAFIQNGFLTGSAEDINPLELTNIDYQKCKFGFIDSIPLTEEILENIIVEKENSFLALSPNSDDKIEEFELFQEFTSQLIEILELPIEVNIRSRKLYLNYNVSDENEELFRTIYNLHKVQWLNAQDNKIWKKDFESYQLKNQELPGLIKLKIDGKTDIEINDSEGVRNYISKQVKTSNSLLKTYLNFIKTYWIINDADDIDEYVAMLKSEIIISFGNLTQGSSINPRQDFIDRYFETLGMSNISFLKNYNPTIPDKKEMCAFSGSLGKVEYNAQVAFGMKARGFSNRTITSLNNTKSKISNLQGEENRLRVSLFKNSQANLIAYYDFFEINLPISSEIIKATVKSKNKDYIQNQRLEFDANVSFDYDLGFEFTAIKESKKVSYTEACFWFVRSHLKLLKELGVRTFITNLGGKYEPHKAAFYFKGAPLFLKNMSWNSVRLNQVDEVLDEMDMIYSYGKKRVTNTLLTVSQNRRSYFRLLYTMNEDEKKKIQGKLLEFYNKYKFKFSTMTITEKLVALAVEIDIGYQSSAEETWLIRTGLEFLRKYHKQQASREDIIQKISGEIYRKKRMSNPDMDAISAFATAIYDDLFLEDWKSQIPSINQEKDWIYQFAFLFREKSLQVLNLRKSMNLRKKLDEKKEDYTEENIKNLLPKEQKKYANQYLETIKNLKK